MKSPASEPIVEYQILDDETFFEEAFSLSLSTTLESAMRRQPDVVIADAGLGLDLPGVVCCVSEILDNAESRSAI